MAAPRFRENGFCVGFISSEARIAGAGVKGAFASVFSMGVPVNLQSDLAVFHQFLLKLVQVERINPKGLHCRQSLVD